MRCVINLRGVLRGWLLVAGMSVAMFAVAQGGGVAHAELAGSVSAGSVSAWTDVVTDAVLAVSFVMLFASLTWMGVELWPLAGMRKARWVVISTGGYLLACGARRGMQVLSIWWPLHPASTLIKGVCAVVILPTAIVFAMKVAGIAREIRQSLKVLETTTQERDLAREQLEREQLMREKRIEALSHMAGGLAHEISNPLAIIHGKASDLERMAAEGEANGEMLDAVEVHALCTSVVFTAERAMKILRGLRGFGREAAKDPLEPADVREIIDGCVELQQSRLERENVELIVELEPGLPDILCRETQIGQILTNLLNNGFDAIVQSGTEDRWIAITAIAISGEVYIDVTNSGPQIDENLKAHLMEPFFTTKEFSMGTGVGLSLSRAIAQDHGGTLTLRDGLEHTCFRLTVPIRPMSGDEQEDAGRGGYGESGLRGALSN